MKFTKGPRPEAEPIHVNCPCGEAYYFKPEYSGVLVQCPMCRQVYSVPDVGSESFSAFQRFAMKREGLAAEVVTEAEVPPWRRVYFITQQVWSLLESYEITLDGKILCVADRARRFNNVAIYAGLTVGLFILALLTKYSFVAQERGLYVTFGSGIILVVMIALRFKFRKRDAIFWGDEWRFKPEFFIRDLNRLEFPYANFRVEDTKGALIGTLRKPWIGDILQSPWSVRDASGNLIYRVEEDSLLLSLLKRFFITKLFWFRTNFVFLDPETEEVFGHFKREWKVRDVYKMDLSSNRSEADIRLLWALGVLLDSAERR